MLDDFAAHRQELALRPTCRIGFIALVVSLALALPLRTAADRWATLPGNSTTTNNVPPVWANRCGAERAG